MLIDLSKWGVKDILVIHIKIIMISIEIIPLLFTINKLESRKWYILLFCLTIFWVAYLQGYFNELPVSV